MIDRKHEQGTHCTKIFADQLAENTQMPQNISALIVWPSPKDWDFHEKMLHWASVVRGRVFMTFFALQVSLLAAIQPIFMATFNGILFLLHTN